MKEVVSKINDVVGDGMMMVIVLLEVIFCEGFKMIVVGGDLMVLICGII